MDRTLKRGSQGHITRAQWVISGYVPDRQENDKAFFNQYLWDFGPPVAHGGFAALDDEFRIRQQMEDDAKAMVEKVRRSIMVGLESVEDFAIGSDDEIKVTFHRHETEGHLYRIAVQKAGQQPIVIEDDFSENWEAGELGQKVEDVMMEVAAKDPDAVPAVAEEEHPEPTLGELLGHQLHAISTRNLMLSQNIRLGEILAGKFGLVVAGALVAALEEAQGVLAAEKIRRDSSSEAGASRLPTTNDLMLVALATFRERSTRTIYGEPPTMAYAKDVVNILGLSLSEYLIAAMALTAR